MAPPSPPGGLVPALGRAAAAVAPAIAAAAERTGADFATLFETARLESGFNPSARARTSSATGLFQFIESTWLDLLDRHGTRHGIAPASRAQALALRSDPAVASLMAAESMAENGRFLERRLGRAAGPVDLYLAHFLGPGGALRFLSALASAPEARAAPLFPQAAAANRAVFFAGGLPRSLQEIYAFFASRLAGGTDAPPGSSATGSAVPPSVHGARPPALPPAVSTAAVAETASETVARHAARAAYLLLAGLGA